jgi:uncharacterized protein YjbI with pentapeptide repeats
MAQCIYHKFCGRDGGEDIEEDLCILHSENPEKDRVDFGAALAAHREGGSDNFSHFVFPAGTSFHKAVFTGPAFFEGALFAGDVDFSEAKFDAKADFDSCRFGPEPREPLELPETPEPSAPPEPPEASFRSTTFAGPVDFRDARFYAAAKFSGATFTGVKEARLPSIRFSGTKFLGPIANFCESTFEQGVGFDEAEFAESADFRKVSFSEEGGAFFRRAKFKHAWFDQVEFPCCPDFEDVQFLGDVDFTLAKFTRGVDLARSTFSGEALFGNTTFVGRIIFAEVAFTTRPPDFTNAKFRGHADFLEAKFCQGSNFLLAHFVRGAGFRKATFCREANFLESRFSGYADYGSAGFGRNAVFQKAVFERGGSFLGTQFSGDVDFYSAEFLGRTTFASNKDGAQMFCGVPVDMRSVVIAPLDALVIRGADLKLCRFLDTDLRGAEFTDVTWPKIKNRDGVHDEEVLGNNERPSVYSHVERLYRELKQNREDRRDYERAGDFHYGQKEMRRKQARRFSGLRFWLNLYKWASGYGEQWLPPLLWGGLILFSCTAGYLRWGLGIKGSCATLSWMSGFDGWRQVLDYSVRTMFLLKPDDLVATGISRHINTFQSLAGPLFLGLFALALRQRLKR